ncbi:MAG: hypothetical protein FWH41_02250 [Treponema sp.]|nr:hypothetical protein [Treponema sp.]
MKKKKKEEEISAEIKISEYIQKHRKLLLVSAIVIILLFIASIVTVNIISRNKETAILTVEKFGIRFEELQKRYEELKQRADSAEEDAEDSAFENEESAAWLDEELESVNLESVDEESVVPEEEAVAAEENLDEETEEIADEKQIMSLEEEMNIVQSDFDALLSDLETFANENSGYPAYRAWWLAGRIYADREEWAEAEKAWAASSKEAKNSILAPLAWYNAAVAAEHQGKIPEAIEYFTNSVSIPSRIFIEAPRAYFSIGRLSEFTGDIDAAMKAYNSIVNDYSFVTPWANLAQSRIILLEIQAGGTGSSDSPEGPGSDDSMDETGSADENSSAEIGIDGEIPEGNE